MLITRTVSVYLSDVFVKIAYLTGSSLDFHTIQSEVQQVEHYLVQSY